MDFITLGYLHQRRTQPAQDDREFNYSIELGKFGWNLVANHLQRHRQISPPAMPAD
jgi:hypothetical protein